MLDGWGRRVGRDSMTIEGPPNIKIKSQYSAHDGEMKASIAARVLISICNLKYEGSKVKEYVRFGVGHLQ